MSAVLVPALKQIIILLGCVMKYKVIPQIKVCDTAFLSSLHWALEV